MRAFRPLLLLSFLLVPVGARATPTPTPAATPVCGDGVVVFPETCDPPGSVVPPNGTLCRPDCTLCGDGITQLAGGESCDDGNAVSGCRPDKPQKPLDGCLNSCQRPICDDPAKIQQFDEASTGKEDVVQVHARLVTDREFDFAAEPFELEISRRLCSHDPSLACSSDAACDGIASGSVCTSHACSHDPATLCGSDATCDSLAPGSTCSLVAEASLVFRQMLSGGIPLGTPSTWRYRNVIAKTQGGVGIVKVKGKVDPKRCYGGTDDGDICQTGSSECPGGACVGYYQLTLTAYGDAERAVTDMQTRIIVGGQRWAVRGLWTRFPHAWKLGKQSPLLEPWP